MKSYTVDIHQVIRFEIEAENEDEAREAVVEGEVWMPDHTGDAYEYYVEVEEND